MGKGLGLGSRSGVRITSVVAVIAANIATAVDSFHRITTATAVAIDVFDGQCSVGTPLTISNATAASDMVNSECL